MSYRTIRQAQQAIWPRVKISLGLHRASRAALRNGRGGKVTAMQERDARKSWDRIVMDEAVWALAKADLLASPEQAAVITAAREWVRIVGPDVVLDRQAGDDDPTIAADWKLYQAVQALATAPMNPVDERLDFQPAVDYRPTQNNSN